MLQNFDFDHGDAIPVELFHTIMNQLPSNIYIADAATGEIIFMNQAMKETFHLEKPEGRICWQVLQKGMEKRCEFCKVDQVLKVPEGKKILVWEEKNPLTGRIYKNYDCIFYWNQKAYHMQNSIDETEMRLLSEAAAMDELTDMLNRRTGKEQLEKIMGKGKKERKNITVVLYDVNELKQVNDKYGHNEGDKLLRYITAVAKKHLREQDLIFRLSGDEFIIAYYDMGLNKANERMKLILQQLADQSKENNIFYNASFSYGLMEVYPEDRFSVSDVISRADEQMYIQKRNYHILRAQQKLLYYASAGEQADEFQYNKDKLFDALMESTDDYIFAGNMKTGTFRYPPSMVADFGLPGQTVENAAAFWGKLIHPQDKKIFLESNQEIADGRADFHNVEYRAKNNEGEWIKLRCRGYSIRDEQGQPDLFAGFITNLEKKSHIDYMTGLYNKYQFENEIKKMLMDQSGINRIDIMILNMDSFKNINDLYNRNFGDEVIRVTAQKMVSLLPNNAKSYRMDGDEFGIIVYNGDDDTGIRIFKNIQNVFQKQQEYCGKKYYSTLSAGCACYPRDGDNYLDLIKYANYALQYSKDTGKNRITVFSDKIMSHKKRKLDLIELLRESVEHDFSGFSISYQPRINTETKRLEGAEALARWHCCQYGQVYPKEFIPLLEEIGLIVPVGQWIFRQAVAQCKKWRKLNEDFTMSINFSYVQLVEGDITAYIREVLKEFQVPPGNIVAELTETCFMKADASVLEMVNSMRQIGLSIAMDHFGQSYSSLYHLKNSFVDMVKIDKTLVKGITSNSFDIIFIKAIIALCHKVNIKICLEGVETKAEYDAVKDCDMEFIQGYYFGQPIKAQMFEKAFFK